MTRLASFTLDSAERIAQILGELRQRVAKLEGDPGQVSQDFHQLAIVRRGKTEDFDPANPTVPPGTYPTTGKHVWVRFTDQPFQEVVPDPDPAGDPTDYPWKDPGLMEVCRVMEGGIPEEGETVTVLTIDSNEGPKSWILSAGGGQVQYGKATGDITAGASATLDELDNSLADTGGNITGVVNNTTQTIKADSILYVYENPKGGKNMFPAQADACDPGGPVTPSP